MTNLDSELLVLTVGHSTRPLGEFIAWLKAHSVARLIDVRTVPRSRHNPQFNRDTLPAALAAAGVGYEHLAGLGGFRRTHPRSLNTGWRNLSFRGYADYMQTSEFADNLAGLIARATHERIVLMCAEALPWRCHRSLIADALLVHGLRVEEIASGTRRPVHVLTRFAKVSGLVITYPPETSPPDSAVMDVDVDGTNEPLARVAHRATIRPINWHAGTVASERRRPDACEKVTLDLQRRWL